MIQYITLYFLLLTIPADLINYDFEADDKKKQEVEKIKEVYRESKEKKRVDVSTHLPPFTLKSIISHTTIPVALVLFNRN